MELAPSAARLALKRYLEREAGWLRQSGAPDTNFFVPHGPMYAVPEAALEGLFALQSACWREGAEHCLMEKQVGDTCLVVDVDADYAGAGQPGAPSQFSDREFNRLSVAVAHALHEVFDWEAHGAALAREEPALFAPRDADPALGPPNPALECGVHVAYLVRPRTKAAKTAGAQWREGLHAVVFVRAPPAARRYLFERLAAGNFAGAFSRLGAARLANPQSALDPGPVTAPIALLGSPTKPGGAVYQLAALHRLRFGHLLRPADGPLAPALDSLQDPPMRCAFLPPGPAPAGRAWEAFLTVSPCDPQALACPAWELSVAHQAPGGAVRKWGPPLRAAAAAACARAPAAGPDAALAEAAFMSPAVAYWRSMLGLVKAEQLSRNEWRDVVYAVASLGPEPHWRLLAEEFSARARHRGGQSRAADLAGVWPGAGRAGVTWRTILFRAKRDAPEEYHALRQTSALARLRDKLLANNGELTHHVAAEVLHYLFRDRYVAVEAELAPRSTRGRPGWYELGHPGREPRLTNPGDEWKWNYVGARPASLAHEITGVLSALAKQVLAQALEQADAGDGNKAFIRELKLSCRRLQGEPFIRGALQRAADLFADYRFAASLDRDPRYFGIAGGVLEVCDASDRPPGGDWVQVHTALCAAPVSLYTAVQFAPELADPQHPARRRLRQVLGDIFGPRYDWVMKYSSLALRGGRKTAAFMVMLIGGGNNGKSVFLELMRTTFGHFGYKAPVSILTSAREKGQDANSAYAAMKRMRFIYFSEPEGDGHDQRNALRMARVKEMLSPEAQSTRGLHASQENFILEAVMFASTNNDFTVQENNYSVWKRLVRVVCETRFVPNPHPDDPREKLEDPSVSDSYINSPETQSAFLAELAHHYAELQDRYGGNIKRVPNAQVRADTQFFREAQDLIHQFIRAHVCRRARPVELAEPAAEPGAAAEAPAAEAPAAEAPDPRAAPDYDTDPLAVEVAQAYNRWRTRCGAGRIPPTTALRELRDSVLGRYHYSSADRREYFRGVRVLDEGEAPAPGEEPLVAELDVPVAG